jgi:hypothetical protein
LVLVLIELAAHHQQAEDKERKKEKKEKTRKKKKPGKMSETFQQVRARPASSLSPPPNSTEGKGAEEESQVI